MKLTSKKIIEALESGYAIRNKKDGFVIKGDSTGGILRDSHGDSRAIVKVSYLKSNDWEIIKE